MLKISLFMFILVFSDANANDVTSCDYRTSDLCGNVCIYHRNYCHCHQEIFNIRRSNNYCCLDSDDEESCFLDDEGDAHCPRGVVLDRSEPCRGVCYNDYRFK